MAPRGHPPRQAATLAIIPLGETVRAVKTAQARTTEDKFLLT
jgi:hypothetical protein